MGAWLSEINTEIEPAEWRAPRTQSTLTVGRTAGVRRLGDLVLATARQRGRGTGSGAPMDAEATFVFTVRGGLIARWQMFASEAQALEAVEPAE